MMNTMPVIAAGAMACVLLRDDERQVFGMLNERVKHGQGSMLALYLCTLSVLVFSIVFAEFRLVQLTSALTLSVFGVVKEVLTVIIAFLAGDRFSLVNAVGLVLCILGNCVYFLKRTTPEELRTAQLQRSVTERERDEAEQRPVILDAGIERSTPPEGEELDEWPRLSIQSREYFTRYTLFSLVS